MICHITWQHIIWYLKFDISNSNIIVTSNLFHFHSLMECIREKKYIFLYNIYIYCTVVN